MDLYHVCDVVIKIRSHDYLTMSVCNLRAASLFQNRYNRLTAVINVVLWAYCVCVRVIKNEWTGWKCCVLALRIHASWSRKIRMLTVSRYSTWQMLNHEEILDRREAASSPPFVAPTSQRGWNFPGKLIAGCWQDVTDNTANNAGSRWLNTRF